MARFHSYQWYSNTANNIKEPTNIEALLLAEVNFYPNPFEDRIRLVEADGCLLRVFSMLGKAVYVQKIATSDKVIQLKRLSAGVYFFRLEKD